MNQLNIRSVVVGSQFSTSQRAVALAESKPNELFAAVGLHPVHLFSMNIIEEGMPFVTRKEVFEPEKYRAALKSKSVVAIGECGLDYHQFPEGEDKLACKKLQWEVLQQHIVMAKKSHLPCIIHCRASSDDYRDAYRDLFSLLKQENFSNCVIHAFATYHDMVEKFLRLGCCISYTGLVTYPEYRDLIETVRFTPIDRLLIETDAPYMSPVPKRHQRNEPSYLPFVAQAIANIKKIPVEEVAAQTTKNAVRLFELPPQAEHLDVH